MLNALAKGMRSFVAVVGCSGGRDWGWGGGTMLWWMTVKRGRSSQAAKCG